MRADRVAPACRQVGHHASVRLDLAFRACAVAFELVDSRGSAAPAADGLPAAGSSAARARSSRRAPAKWLPPPGAASVRARRAAADEDAGHGTMSPGYQVHTGDHGSYACLRSPAGTARCPPCPRYHHAKHDAAVGSAAVTAGSDACSGAALKRSASQNPMALTANVA